jgi:predicted RNA-binding protein with PUA domain
MTHDHGVEYYCDKCNAYVQGAGDGCPVCGDGYIDECDCGPGADCDLCYDPEDYLPLCTDIGLKHNLVSDDHGGPESGYIGAHCTQCPFEFFKYLY